MCHASLCCLVLCKPFNDLFFFPQPVVFLIAGAKVRPFLLSGKLSGTFFFKKMRIFKNPDMRRGGLLIIYTGGGGRTVPPRRGTSPEGAERVSRPRAAIMAVLCAMRDGSGGGKPLRPCGPPPLQGGGVPTTQQKFQSPEHRVSEPGTHSFKAWNTQFQSPEHTVSNAWNTQFQTPETLRHSLRQRRPQGQRNVNHIKTAPFKHYYKV